MIENNELLQSIIEGIQEKKRKKYQRNSIKRNDGSHLRLFCDL